MLLLLNVRAVERKFSATGRNHVVFALVPVLLKGGRKMPENVIAYKISVSVFRNFLKMGLMTANEFVQVEQILAEKYGLSLCSIFREIA